MDQGNWQMPKGAKCLATPRKGQKCQKGWAAGAKGNARETVVEEVYEAQAERIRHFEKAERAKQAIETLRDTIEFHSQEKDLADEWQ